MRILLPPSEAKTQGGDGPSLREAGFGDGPLAAARAEVARALAAFCRDDPEAATVALRLPASSAAEELAANVAIMEAPTTPALDRFVGVLYDSLGASTLPPAARAVADSALFVSNGAFGLIGATEPIPDHRVGMAAAIPGLAGRAAPTVLAAFWRARLAPVISDLLLSSPPGGGGAGQAPVGEHLVIDLRSSDYASAPALSGPLRAGAVPVRALTEKHLDGRWVRRPLSYQAKQTKGALTRALVLAEAGGRLVKTIDDVAEVAESAGFVAETGGTTARPTLEVVTRWGPSA